MIRLLLLAALALPAAELRGVWVDRSSLESRDSIRDMMQNLASANFNAAFVNVWSRGYPIWQSDVFERETGIRIDPTYKDRDVLNELIEEGRDAGIAVFPWAEYGFIGGYSNYFPGENGRGPIFDAHPEWLARTASGDDRFPIAGAPGQYFYYMIHTHPAVHQFLLELMAEVVEKYNVPGLQFDRARYPQADCGYDDYTVALYRREHDGNAPPSNPSDTAWTAWRARKLNEFSNALYRRLKHVDWRTLVSNAPTVYPNSLTNFAQDWPSWMREGSLDFVVPQVYRADLAAYQRDLATQLRAVAADPRRVVPGVDITNTTPEVLIAQIEHTRAQNLKGIVIWYYAGLVRKDALKRLKETVFAEPAPLPWR
jgi:uncharacterized lipoprotein YddW (UPF0748 family)